MPAPRVKPTLRSGPAAAIASSSSLLGLIVAIASWNVAFAPPLPGLDPSWWAAMYMGAHRGLHFGTQIVFTYGPLAFLRLPWLWYQNLAVIGFLYSAALDIALACSVVFALRRTLPAPLTVVLAAGVLLATPARDVSLVLVAIWCLIALSSEAPPFAPWVVLVGGAVLGAVELLVELRSGPVIWAMALIAVAASPDWRRRVPLFLGCAAVACAALWFASGQTLGDVNGFASNELQIVSGYSQAMGIDGGSTAPVLVILATIGIGIAATAAAAFTSAPGRRRIGGALAIALLAFALYKEAVVRAEPHHETIFFSTFAVLCTGFAYGARKLLGLAAVVAMAVVAWEALPADTHYNLNPVTHAKSAFDGARLVVSPGRRARSTFFTAVGLTEHYRLDPQTLSLLRGHTVHIDPWEAAVAWTYGLDWDPVPVFQNYSAYTSELDMLDANSLSSSRAPARVLRENTLLVESAAPAIDGRLAAWEAPAMERAMLCNYVPLRTTARWQVLGKSTDRCGTPRLIAHVTTQFGQAIAVPAANPHGILYATVRGVAVSGILDTLRTFLYRSRFRYATINAGTTYRLVPGTAADGLLMSVPRALDFPAPFALSPDVRTLRFTGLGGPLQIDFEWLPVRRDRGHA